MASSMTTATPSLACHGRHSRLQQALVVGLLRFQRRRRAHGSAGAATDAAFGGHGQVVAFHENGTRRTRLGAATAGSVAIAHHHAPARLHRQRLALKLLESPRMLSMDILSPLTAAWRNKIRPALHSRSAWRLDIHVKDQRGPNRCGHGGSFHKSSSPNPLLSMAKTPRSVNEKEGGEILPPAPARDYANRGRPIEKARHGTARRWAPAG